MPSLISVNNLTRHYGDFCAVENISFELNSGDILGFLGPNGAGKSTTMQMLSGNLAPTTGAISINDIDLLEQPKLAKTALGYLPENPPLYQDMTVSEYLRFCAQLHLIRKLKLNSVCESAIERCGLNEVSHRLIGNLSKGFQQRVGIAQAILHTPPVIILDEPTVGLDPIQILEIRQLIKDLGKNHGIILCTHILPEVQAVCNRVQIMNRGQLVYNANLNGLENLSDTKYEISLASKISDSELASHRIFKSIVFTDDHSFLADSDLNPEQLTEYICRQQWGLTRFARHEESLEQIFIDITLNEENVNKKDRGAPSPG